MSEPTRDEHWLPHFRRSLGYLRPHRRPLFIGLAAALGVGLFYTFTLSSAVPLLKVIFAEHESLVDWLHRAQAETRLGAAVPADVPDEPRGLLIVSVRPGGASAGVVQPGDRLTELNGSAHSSYSWMRAIATGAGARLEHVRIERSDGSSRDVALPLHAPSWWFGPAMSAARLLPEGRSAEERLWTLAAVMLALVVMTLLGGFCRFINEGQVATAVQRGMHDLRSGLADHVLRLPLQWHSTHPPGDALGRFATDISKVEVGINTLFGKTIREPIKAIGVLALTVAIDWRMLVVALLGIPVGALIIRQLGRMVKRAQRLASQSWGRLLDHLGERLAGIRVVKAYNMEQAESRRFETEGRELTRAQTHIELVDAATNPALEVLAMLAVTAFVLYGGARVFRHELEPHLFFAAVVCLAGTFDPVRKLGNVNNRMQAADVSARRLFELMDLPAETAAEPRAAAALPPMQREIEFRDICFAYDGRPERLVLDHVSLIVPRGQCVALVGPNGSGKTTLMSLLLRFFEPGSGRILIDGRDIRDASLASLRGQIGLVTQEAVVFSGTALGNIAYGANGVTPEQARSAARRAHADEFVRALRVEQNGVATAGYDAPISARTLSGGQKQRIVLARAIVREPTILILDEATSQVDTESERNIQDALDDVTRGRTTFIIAHRFSTIARADVIVVLDEGRIVGRGGHDDLMKTCPTYVNLYETQFARGGA